MAFNAARFLFPVLVATLAVGASGAAAQTMSERLARKTQGGDSRMLVEAREIVYDRNKDTVSAVGDVQIYYEGKVLEADRVIYDKPNKRVTAIGNTRLREPAGQIVYGDRFELTDDFRDGFIDSVRTTTPQKTRLSAPRAERTDGETTVFERGTYTACEPCKDDPAKPPLWQVRASRIIHKNEERMIYYENASFDVAGVPIFWMPYISAPDATVKRKSGFLPPRYIANNQLGTGVSLPFFWNIAPHYDLTITPTLLSRQGVLAQAEWRHRLEHGSYLVRAAGISQQDKGVFLPGPNGPGDKELRGSLETVGNFLINEKWNWGWDLALVSDKWFFRNYRVRSESLRAFNTNALQSSTSTLYLRGKGERSFFDMRSFYFKTLSAADPQNEQPIVLPVLDYDRRFETPWALEGETRLTMNLTSLTRDQADYRSLLTMRNGSIVAGRYQLNGRDTCLTGAFVPASCYIRGIAGSYQRATTEVAWRRNFIDPVGQSWTPFTALRGDLTYASLDAKNGSDAFQTNFISADADPFLRSMATIGMTYRFPFIAGSAGGAHVIEPIAQIIMRPGETRVDKVPNEDAQSLVYDDTNLFATDKFSGYDRIEGGTRANIGAAYTFAANGGAYVNALVGQSVQLAGRNPFTDGGVSRTGLDSGLETRRADYVGRIQFMPNRTYAFAARSRFDESSLALRRLEVQASANFERFSTSLVYGRYDAQPDLGYFHRREGVSALANVKLDANWYVFGGTTLDFARNLAQQEISGVIDSTAKTGRPGIAAFGLGAGYKDDCTLVELAYSNSARNAAEGTQDRVQTILLRLEFRTLGKTRLTQTYGTAADATQGR